MTTAAPQGTVTFVFTDIEGSTDLLERLGDRYAEVVAEHRKIVRKEFGGRGGVEMDTQGDAFFFSFARARAAVAAAVATQLRLAAHSTSSSGSSAASSPTSKVVWSRRLRTRPPSLRSCRAD